MTAEPPTVLLVDDDPDLLAVLAVVFEDAGYRVVRACDGMEALARAETHPPDVVVSDVRMPRLDGVGLAQRLRERDGRLPVVLMSGDYRALGVPGVAFVAKPFAPADLLAAVAAARGRR